jgi:hypothetical protein
VLRLRADGGEDPSLLGRQDVVDFLVRLRARQLRGEITNVHQRNCVTRLRAMLRDARERGLHREPGALAGLSEKFTIVDADVPRKLARERFPDADPSQLPLCRARCEIAMATSRCLPPRWRGRCVSGSLVWRS